MSKLNAKASPAPAAPTTEQLMELVLKLKAENEALKASTPKAGVSLSSKGGINVTVPSGKGSVILHFYSWQWTKLSSMKDEIDAFAKKNADKLITEIAFRASKQG